MLNPVLSDRVTMKNLTQRAKKEEFGDLSIKAIPDFESKLTAIDNDHNKGAGLPLINEFFSGTRDIDPKLWDLPLSQAYHQVGRPYLRAFSQFLLDGDSRIQWVTCSPLVSKIFSEAEVWVVDLTFNEIVEKGETVYLMNIVTYLEELDRCKDCVSSFTILKLIPGVLLLL